MYRCLLYAEMSIDIELQIKADRLNKKNCEIQKPLAYLQHHIYLSSCDIGGLIFIVLLKMPNRPFKLNNSLSMRATKRAGEREEKL